MKLYRALSFFLTLALLISACGGAATSTASTEPPPTPVSAEPHGPYRITGTLTFTNQFVTVASLEDAVALADMHGFATRDLEWEMPAESQTLGYINLDRENLTGDYWIQLPAKPEGQLADVDNNDHSDPGVQVFAVAYWPNYLGGPFSEGDDPSLGWVEDLASVKTDSENRDEVIGGKLVVWSPDDGQQFPTGFGDDGLLFTRDDPAGPIPAGWSVVDLDQTPFAVSQEAEPTLDLYERPDSATKDYSALSYTEAFDKLFERVSTDWAFNGSPGKEVDWQKLYKEIAPRVAEAEKKKDKVAFYKALRDFAISIPDGHTGLNGGVLQDAEFARETDGGFGFAIRELDDGKVIVVFVTPGGPAEEAGMQVGAEITEFNGGPIGEAIGKVIAYFVAPFSEESFKRYQQARYLLRTPVGAEATVAFTNPGGEPQTATLTSI
ncbi:MAG: PDZ domain-containing protein, partial [Chloroflexota bacterium]